MRRAIVFAALACVAAVVLPAGILAQAPVPTWTVGDTFAFGTRVDLGQTAAPVLALIRQQDLMNDNITIHGLNLTGSLDIWNVFEVTGATSSVYTMTQDSATGLEFALDIVATSRNFPVPGVYPGTVLGGACVPPVIPSTATRSWSVVASMSSLATAPGTSTWNVSDLALRTTDTDSTNALRASVSGRGIPMTTTDATTCAVTVAYEDVNLAITADVSVEVRTSYSPALDLFDFPIVDGETWWANSTATVGGRMTGRIDVTGLDPDVEAEYFAALNQFFQASGISVTGLTGFPIVLEQITVTLGTVNYIENGVIRDYPSPVSILLNATQSTMTLADGQFHTVYLISAVSAASGGVPMLPTIPGGRWVYSPDDGFIVGFVVEVAPGIAVFELEPVPAATARTRIEETKTNYAPSSGGDPVTGFFLNPPYLGLILLAAAVVVVVSVLLLRGRRKPAATSPSPPPPIAPPPGDPPRP